jgi:hypothetical protein
MMGNTDAAIEYYHNALSFNPDDTTAEVGKPTPLHPGQQCLMLLPAWI